MNAETPDPVETADRDVRNVLAPLLERLSLEQPPADGPGRAALLFGDHRVELEAWERSTIEDSLDGSGCGNGGPDEARLLLDGYALQAKCVADASRIDATDVDELPVQVREDLTNDAVVGLVLLEESQRAINTLILSGKIDHAKRISGFRNKLAHTVSGVREHIGDEAFRRAAEQSARLLPPVEMHERVEPSNEPPAQMPRKRKSAPVRARRTAKTDGSNLKLLLPLLAAAAVAWVIVVLPRFADKPLPVLTVDQLPHATAIHRMVARPPSMFIEVDGGRWERMSPGDRRAMIEDVGRTAAAAGYTGVRFTSTAGGQVGEWLRQSGATLTGESASRT